MEAEYAHPETVILRTRFFLIEPYIYVIMLFSLGLVTVHLIETVDVHSIDIPPNPLNLSPFILVLMLILKLQGTH